MYEVMRSIDEQYRAVASVSERREYKIFYSHIHPFPLLILGQNPGGAEDADHYVASDGYFENWEHDFLCFRHNPAYSLAGPMCNLLSQALDTQSVNTLRQIPATNVIFRRSQNTAMLTLSPSEAAREARPFLEQIVRVVNPLAILFISKTAYDLFAKLHCRTGSVVERTVLRVFTPNGRSRACIFLRAQAFVNVLSEQVPLLMVGHPSKYSARAEWPQVLEALVGSLHELGVSPIESTGAIRPLPTIEAYGTLL